MNRGISIMVPALNEEKLIKQTIENIRKAAHMQTENLEIDIIIVNDGSTDRTGPIADQIASQYPSVHVLHNHINIGVGNSFKRVLRELELKEKFLFIAGDADMPFDLMVSIFKNAFKADLVFAYFLNREARGKFRNLISLTYQMIYMFTFGVFVMYLSGPCVYPSSLIKKFAIRSNRFSVPTELTVKCLRSGCSFFEIAGYMQTGAKDSKALKWKNLIETVLVYFRLVSEIFVERRRVFKNNPKRVVSST